MSGHADGGARRRQVLEAIYRSPAPLGASEIAGQVGIHPNTVRFHLSTLMAEGKARLEAVLADARSSMRLGHKSLARCPA